MRCPSCGSLDTQVKDSRPTEDSSVIRRRRVCLSCNFRFTTFERVQLRELIVIKRNGRRVPFDRDKLLRSVQIALRKRPVEPERIDQMVSKIVRELESQGESEVSSETIGETVMAHLRDLDDVAYVRFARSIAISARPRISRRRWPNYRAKRLPRSHASERGRWAASGRCERKTSVSWRSLDARPARAWPHLAQSRRRRGDRERRRHRRPRLDANRRPAACRRSRRCAAPAAARGATLYVTLEPARITANRRLAPTPSSPPASRASSRRWKIPIRRSPAKGMRGCVPPALRSRSASAPRRRAAIMPGTSGASATAGPHVMLKLAISADGKVGAAGRKPVGDHRREPRATASISCGPRATRSWSASAPRWPTIRC